MTEKWSSDLEQESIYGDKAEGVSQLTSLSAALSLSLAFVLANKFCAR